MRLLAITNLYPRAGHETIAAYNSQQFQALSQKHELRVIAPVAWTDVMPIFGGNKPARRYVNANGIWVDHPVYRFPPRILEHRYGQFYLASVRGAVDACLREFAAEGILGCWAHPDGWAAVELARERGLPVVLKVVGSDLLIITRNVRRRKKVLEALREADRVVVVSQHLADQAVKFGVDRRRIAVVYEGINLDIFSPGDRDEARRILGLDVAKPIILFVGNLLLSKGAGVLIEACRRLRDGGFEPFQCVLVGRGRDDARLRAMAAGLNLEGVVHFAGPRPQLELPAWYRACDVFALPSFSEGIPNVLREAAACGRPYVATSVGGIPEIADASSRLVAPGDPLLLANALAETLATKPTVDLKTMRHPNISWSESARQLAAQFEVVRDSRLPQKPLVRMVETPVGLCAEPERPLRVLAITNLYPRLGFDHIASYNRQQFRALARQHELRVIAPIPWTEHAVGILRCEPRARHYFNQDGIQVDHPIYYFPPKLRRHTWGTYYERSISATVEKVAFEFKPNVMLGCWAHPDGWAAVQLAKKLGIPVVVKVHGSDVLVNARHRRRRRSIAEALQRADRVIAVSRDLADEMISLGVEESHISVVLNGVDQDLFFPGDRSEAQTNLGFDPGDAKLKRLLFVGNILASKGVGVLIEACAILTKRSVPFRCHLIGTGHDDPNFRALTGQLGLGEVVTFEGMRPHHELGEWYRACDLMVLPSYSEGIPNVLREAMMCGCGFIATSVGGIPEITRPSLGRLVDVGDPGQLAKSIEQAFSEGFRADPKVALEVNWTWDQSAVRLAQVLRGAVEAGKHS